ncbi:cation diffusion facilitator family transporter [Chitinophaga nivalis]|uniref:Cation diffusion facilitator family transporter n=1 Tax=Chitinophaga nivalis TaxID=2991709 RepID=A0ABT3ISL8_9BACT|nr:cation diffusion facilitator family transporter [Chitinophaga nivalis]MCW3463342.1 cation diffusion facilitator family transporter [Chitinophaga nivalis]MCW3486968.1 cation diffusion facilitator family transporter [Chitinophaga nivalis]
MHDHAHSHPAVLQPSAVNRVFGWGIGLNLAFVVAEFIAGFLTHSLALLSDAGHNLSDVASLALALLAFRLARVKPGPRYTYGYRKSTILISLLNALLLLVVVGGIGYGAIRRFNTPHEVPGGVIAVVAGIGIVINGVTALLFFRDQEKDLNVKGAYLHLVADALVSLGTVIAGIVIIYTGWNWIDPLISLLVMVIIIYGTWGLLRDSLRLSLDGVPSGISLEAVEKAMVAVAGVKSVDHIHVWAISTTENALTAQVKVDPELDAAGITTLKDALRHELEHLGIRHSTLETAC